jgi:hypothetical protein
MKVLKFFGIRIGYLFIFLFLLFEIFFFPLPFIPGKFKDEYVIKNISEDTTFRYQRFNDWISVVTKKNGITGLPYPFTITVIGNTDNETEVYLRYVGFQMSDYSCVLPKGKVDATFHGELYEDRADIVFLHKKAKVGNLKLTFRLGSEVKNTL